MTFHANSPRIFNSPLPPPSLTDHNQLAPKLIADLGDTVVEIVDHHLDVGGHENVIGPQRNIAFDPSSKKALVGSACTLVAGNVVDELKPVSPFSSRSSSF